MNALSQATSPYLLQHASNPVNWYPWGEEALQKSRTEDKPIFLSIGYAACHWCHVMAHESFEDGETAAYMNENFINIKVDREERPDLDGIYMQVVIAMTGSGGWPMSVFLAPDLKPFYAGTYLPPVRRFNMPAFKDVLEGLANAWKNDRSEIEKVGEQVKGHLLRQINAPDSRMPTQEDLNTMAASMQASYDWGYGGWGQAPKFPQAMTLDFLLGHARMGKNEDSIKLVKHCLGSMMRGGMYDVVGGGFARYSTDQFWRVPHFEKMLYDNALLARTYLHAWQVTREPAFKRIVEETLGFVLREMTHAQGGFHSSLDADSEGEEGKFYVWTLEEIRAILGNESEFFEAAYGISPGGNWEGRTVLQRLLDDASLGARFKLDQGTVLSKLADSHSRLLAARSARPRPASDDKILTAWNGLMLAAFAEAGRVLDNQTYTKIAARCATFLLTALRPAGQLRRAWRAEKTSPQVFLEDYAALILGLIELYQSDHDPGWCAAALELADEMIDRFGDPGGGFFDTPHQGEVLLIRPKDIQDNATPSGNALACEALLKLGAYTDEGKYRELAEQALPLVTDAALQYPLGFARWLCSAENAVGQMKQVAVIGEAGDESFERMLQVIHAEYRPNLVMAAASPPIKEGWPSLLKDRPMINGQATAYVCQGFVCRQPTTEIETLLVQLRN